MAELRGKVAIVTGGSAGIGRATTMALAGEGAAIVIGDADIDGGHNVAREIQDKGGRALFVETDVARSAGRSARRQRGRRVRRARHAFNNAGTEGATAITHECTLDNWHRTLAVNLTGVWSCMRTRSRRCSSAAADDLNCSSVAGLVGFAGIPAYTASKHGVVGLTKTRRSRVRRAGHPGQCGLPGRHRHRNGRALHRPPAEAEAAMPASEPVGRLGSHGDRGRRRLAVLVPLELCDRPSHRRRRRLHRPLTHDVRCTRAESGFGVSTALHEIPPARAPPSVVRQGHGSTHGRRLRPWPIR